MKSLHINIFVLIFFIVGDNVSTNMSYMRGIHYPVDHEYLRDCQSEHSGLRGVCKRFSECHSAQKSWLSLRIYPTLCYYNRFESIVCCVDEAPVTGFPSPSTFKQPIISNGGAFHSGGFPVNNIPHNNNQFPSGSVTNNGNNRIVTPNSSINQFPISTGSNQGSFPNTNHQLPISTGNFPNANNQFPIFGSGQQNLPNSNNQFPVFTSEQQNRPNTNNQGSFPNQNSQFPVFGSGQQNRPDTHNQFPINQGNNQGSLPNQNNQFPLSTSGQQNRPDTYNQFPINQGNNQGSFPNQNTQFPVFESSQQNRPDTNNQFPINQGNNQGSFPNQNNQFPLSTSGQQNRPDTNNQLPIFGSGQQNLPNSNNQFPVFTSEQQNRPNTNNQFPINQGNNQGSFPNQNTQFPVFESSQQNRPTTNNQFPTNQGNSPNTNNQFPNSGSGQKIPFTTNNQFPINQGNNQVNPQNTPVAANQANLPDLSDCTVVVIQDPNNPVDSRCVVPDTSGLFQNNQNQNNQNQNTQNQFGQINSQNSQPNSPPFQQDQAANNAEEEEEYIQPRLSQDRCDAVYDVTSLVGGEPTEIGQYPFMAAIGWKRFDDKLEFNCGGFLVSRKFVLTAGHCASLGGDKPFAVRTGGINLDNVTNSDLDIPIEEIIVHPKYQDNQTYNDIALMRLSKSASDEFACLWQKDKVDKEYVDVKAIGYGHTHFGGPRSNSLLQIKLKLFDNKQCSPYYQPELRFPNGVINSQICSGDLTRAKDTCQGDSGGPIFIERISNAGILTPIVIGITSFGQGCAGEAPSLYTRISSFLDWIEPIVWG